MSGIKKGISAFLSVALMLVFLAACGGNGADTSGDKTSKAPSGAGESTPAPQETSETSPGETSGEDIVRDWPHINGSFIQYGPFLNYSEKQLSEHFDYLKEAGIEYLVLYTSAQLTNQGKFSTVYYPSDYVASRKAENYDASHAGITEKMLSQCRAHGIKAYITPINMEGFSIEWAINDKTKVDAFVADTLAVAAEMYDLYKEDYGETFYGWYFAPEFANYFSAWTEEYYTATSEAIDAVLEGYTNLDPDMPFLMSPYFCNRAPYSGAEDTGKAWDKIFSGIRFRKGDIFCPQDCVGSGLADIHDFADYYAEMKKAADNQENLAFWGNPENFVQADWSSAPITRYVLQLEKAAPYVEGFISFAYSHYYAPDICGDDRFHQDYVSYYNTGEVNYYGENPAPAPVSLHLSSVLSGIRLEASFENCKYGISYIEFYRGDEKVAAAYTPQTQYGEETITLSVVDGDVNSGETYRYTAKAFAFTGETAVTEEKSIKASTPENLSIGKSYATDYAGSPSYPDDGKRLTDGKYASTDAYSDPAASGFADCSNVAFVIDLEEERDIIAVVARALNSGSGGAVISTSVRVSFSSDGETFSGEQSLDGPSSPEEAGWSKVEFTVDNVTARYVKVEYVSLRNWLFIDEISVYGAD